jgi:hypothetical protein
MGHVEHKTRRTVTLDSVNQGLAEPLSPLPSYPINSNHEVLSCILQHSSIKDLLTMHLVSSEARSLATPLLYGSITLTHPTQILFLHRTLIQNRRLALLVKRIVFLKDTFFIFSRSLSKQADNSDMVEYQGSLLDMLVISRLATLTLSFPNSNGLHKIFSIDAPIPGTYPQRGFLPFLVLEQPISRADWVSDSIESNPKGMLKGYTLEHLLPTDLHIPARYRSIPNTELQQDQNGFPSNYSTPFGGLKIRPYRFSFLHGMGVLIDPYLEYYLDPLPDTLNRYTSSQRILYNRWLPGTVKVFLLLPGGILWALSYLLGRILSFLVYVREFLQSR